MDCLPQRFLREDGQGGLDMLAKLYHIKSKRHSVFPNLISLKYSQVDSPMSEMLVRQCRGLILDEADNWAIVARPFDKFFNYGEGHSEDIDWSTARVQEKVDGSLLILYNYRGSWEVASSGTPDASGDVNGSDFSFSKLFWDTFTAMTVGRGGLGMLYPGYTYMFELTSKHNRVVVRHTEQKLTLIGVRETATGNEVPLSVVVDFGIPHVKSFQLASIDQVLSTFVHMDPLCQEGYVVVDGLFRRVKVKHPGYVALHHIKDGFGPRRALEIVRSGESSEIITHFPEWKNEFESVQKLYSDFVSKLEGHYSAIASIQNQKEFAILACKTPCSAALFQLRKGKVKTVKEFLAKMDIRSLADVLGMG